MTDLVAGQTSNNNTILSGLEEFSGLLRAQSHNEIHDECEFWSEDEQRRSIERERKKVSQDLTKLREDGVLCDVTLLVGSEKIPIRAHRIILSACYDYFRTMFTSGLKESTEQKVHLPCVDQECMNLMLNLAYESKINLTTENVLKMAICGIFFNSVLLVHLCCEFIRKYTNAENCVQLLQFALKYEIKQMKEDMKLYIVHHIEAVRDSNLDFVRIPVDELLDIVRHPACVVCEGNPQKNERQLFILLWNKMSSFPRDKQQAYIVKLLTAVHLPQMENEYLTYIERQVPLTEPAKSLINVAKKKIDPTETREWYLPRYRSAAVIVEQEDRAKPLEINGRKTMDYSDCVLIKGLPWIVYYDNRDHLWSPTDFVSKLPYQVMAKVIDRPSCKVLYDGCAGKCSFSSKGVFSFRLEIRFAEPKKE